MNWLALPSKLEKLELILITFIVIFFSTLGELLLDSISLLGPFNRSLLDFDLTDLYYYKYYDSTQVVPDKNIVLVNLGRLNRGEIADQLNIINNYKPNTVGMNAIFFDKRDSIADLKLADALNKTKNLVMAGRPMYDSQGNLDSVATSHPMFTKHAVIGISSLDWNSITGVSRSYMVFGKCNHKTFYDFSVILAKFFDPSSFKDMVSRKNQFEMINYKGNLIDNHSQFGKKYYALDFEDVFNGNFAPEQIEGKIVVLCYLGDFLGDVSTLEDKFYSPFNDGLFEKSFPDMFGGVIVANIISNVIERDYIFHKTYFDWILLLVVGFALSLIFRFVYVKLEGTYHLMSKIMAIVFFNLAIFSALSAFDIFRLKIEISHILLFVLFVPDGVEMVLKWVKKLKPY